MTTQRIKNTNIKLKTLKLKTLLISLSMMQMLSNSMLTLAGERESLEQLKATTNSLIDLLVEEGVLSKTKADAMLKKATEDGAKQAQLLAAQAKAGDEGITTNVDDKSVRVQYIPEHVKKKLREEIKAEVLSQAIEEKWASPNVIPEWLDRISFNGDLRLRFEDNSFSEQNFPAVLHQANTLRYSDIANTQDGRRRARLRARLGVDVKVTDWLTGGLRLTTGSQTSPVSPNQTLQSTDSKYNFALDRAYLKAQPTSWLMLEGGRFANPYFSTDLVWDPDLAFDGIASTASYKFGNGYTSFTTVGAFPISELEKTAANQANNKWLYSAQTGIKWESYNKSSAKIAVAYYDFQDVEGTANPVGQSYYNASAPAFRQKGNNTFNINAANGTAGPYGLASKFKLVNITGQIDLATYNPIHATLTADYVRNIAYDQAEIFKRTGNSYSKENEGYQIRLDLGMQSFNTALPGEIKRNDWQISLAYKKLEADAVLDGFTDSDFHLGGTDAKGWLLSGNYGIDKNTWLSARYFSSDSISGLPLGIDVLLLDLNARF